MECLHANIETCAVKKCEGSQSKPVRGGREQPLPVVIAVQSQVSVADRQLAVLIISRRHILDDALERVLI